ncbi:unnamed protein product [Discosporangium mesarthrocarpum]
MRGLFGGEGAGGGLDRFSDLVSLPMVAGCGLWGLLAVLYLSLFPLCLAFFLWDNCMRQVFPREGKRTRGHAALDLCAASKFLALLGKLAYRLLTDVQSMVDPLLSLSLASCCHVCLRMVQAHRVIHCT